MTYPNSTNPKAPVPLWVFLCQGYTLSWMSQHGFFPLENIVHIDPDAFKMMMPEWPDYVARDRDTAGTMCHMESSFMVEAWGAQRECSLFGRNLENRNPQKRR